MSAPGSRSDAVLTPNARLFVWFRVFFNCRFYYPIFAVLFLDLGLTMPEFAALNGVWAVTIVLCEVPSGALADQYGRRRMVVWASWLMVAEMLTMLLMPVGNRTAVMVLFVLNRVLSGLAEAAASGADEALAYDSFEEKQRVAMWPKVMARLSRWSAVGFMVSAISGSMLYDSEVVNGLLAAIHLPTLDRDWVIKLPLFFNLLTALACVCVVRRMTEVGDCDQDSAACAAEIRGTWQQIGETARWIWNSCGALWLIVISVVIDCMVRMFLTVGSTYYRLIEIEERWFGLIGVIGSMIGLLTAGVMERLADGRSARFNFGWLALVTLLGLSGIALSVSGWTGVALVMPLMLVMRFLHFFLSHYLNAEVDSSRRATALSFRGLTLNLAYGVMTLLFAVQTGWIARRSERDGDDPEVFAEALTWWPGWYAFCFIVACVALKWRFRGR